MEIAKADDEEAMLALFEKYKKKELERDDIRAARGDKESKSVDWKKTIDRFGTQIEKVAFDELGDQSRPVVTALKGLVVTIEGVLSVTE